MIIQEHTISRKDHRAFFEPAAFADSDGESACPVRVLTNQARQRWIGLGGAFTEAAASVWKQMPEIEQQAILRCYFDEQEGAGYTLCRSHINSCDFALGNYACVEEEGDTAFRSFSLDREEQYIFPMIRAAMACSAQPLRILLSPWSPPGWMKTNGEMNHGGRLKPEYRETWARLMAYYIRACREKGFDIWGVTVQNEPQACQIWDSCLYSHEEQRDFVRDHLGPALRKAGLTDVRLLVWDHNKDELGACAEIILSDAEAASMIWGIGFHWYAGDHFEELDRVHEQFPDHPLVFTEGCQEGGPHPGSWDVAERYGHAIIGDINHWTTGWIDWNMLLDTQGGPNHVGNYCSAPILADPKKGTWQVQPSYAYIRHLSRSIRPGADILTVQVDGPLEVCAAKNSDATLAVVIMNRTDEDWTCEISGLSNKPARLNAPSHSMQSLRVKTGAQ